MQPSISNIHDVVRIFSDCGLIFYASRHLICETKFVPNSVTAHLTDNWTLQDVTLVCICYMCTAVPLAVGVTVDPDINTCTLGDLKSDTEYEVQVSGFTRMGEGVRSRASLFATNQYQGCAFIACKKQNKTKQDFQRLSVHFKPSSFQKDLLTSLESSESSQLRPSHCFWGLWLLTGTILHACWASCQYLKNQNTIRIHRLLNSSVFI